MKACSAVCSYTILIILFFAINVHAQITMSPPFTDHMVLQRKMPVPIWGTATAGEQVTVNFNGQAKTTKCGADGKWKIVLKQMKEPARLP